MSDAIPVEFVGGPFDGKQLWVPSLEGDLKVQELDPHAESNTQSGKVAYIEHSYRLRKVEGILVRLPNGWHAMDHQTPNQEPRG